jgi:ribonuclease E
VREEIGSKGAMMTAQISLPGRYLVLTPGNPINGISRKIESREEREHFKKLIDELDIPRQFGVIVRTASLGVTKEDFQRDLDYLLDTYKEVLARYKHRQGPGLAWQEDDVVTRTLRDAFTADVEEVHIDDLETFHAAQNFFKRTMPQHQQVLKHYLGKKPLFSRYQTEEQIDRIYARKVALPSGGSLAIDQTEALVAIDVNSGKTAGDNVEDMAHRTNMEAAEEAARQLRLRDLAGLVVIDFIDMKREGNNRAVMERLVECLKEDKARMEVGKINRFGVLVMTRQRLRPSLQNVTHEACPTCQGTGKVKSVEALVISVVRRIKAILSRDPIAEIRVKLMPPLALAVLNQKRKDLTSLEDMYGSRIVILADPEIPFGEMAAEIERAEESEAEKAPARTARERQVEPEDETVVLGGDTPISFEKALGLPEENRRHAAEGRPAPAAARESAPREHSDAEIKYDRRDAQRAALEERERLRALFESAKPLDDEDADEATTIQPAASPEPATGGARRRGRGGRKSAAVPEPAAVPAAAQPAPEPEPEPEPQPERLPEFSLDLIAAPAPAPRAVAPAPVPEPIPAPRPEPEPAPLVLTADLVADLIAPAPRPRLSGAALTEAAAETAAPAAPRRGRTAKPKAPARKAAAEAEPAGEPAAAPAARKPGRATKAKADKAVEAEPAPARTATKSRKK